MAGGPSSLPGTLPASACSLGCARSFTEVLMAVATGLRKERVMRITERQFEEVIVLDLVGPIAGEKASAQIDEAVRRQSRAGRSIVVANLNSVRSVDLAGLSALVEAYATMRRVGGVLQLACVTKRIHDLLVITRL